MKKSFLLSMVAAVSVAVISGCSNKNYDMSPAKSKSPEAVSEAVGATDAGYTVYMEGLDNMKLSEVKPGSEIGLGIEFSIPSPGIGEEVQSEKGCFRNIREVLFVQNSGGFIGQLNNERDKFVELTGRGIVSADAARFVAKKRSSVLWIPVQDEETKPADGSTNYMHVAADKTFTIFNVDAHDDVVTFALTPLNKDSQNNLCGPVEMHPSAGVFQINLRGKDRGKGKSFTLGDLKKIVGDKASLYLAR